MNPCIVCGQPLPPKSRRDKQTCSPGCRNQLYQQRKDQTSLPGSLTWQPQPHLTQPVEFPQRLPTPTSASALPGLSAQKPDPRLVADRGWDRDTLLVAKDLLQEAYEELDHVVGWPDNLWGANADPLTGDPLLDEEDVVGALQGHLDALHASLDKLYQLRGRVERWLVPQQEAFRQGLIELGQEIRIFSQGVAHVPLDTRYKIIYQPGLVRVATALRERVRQGWFTFNYEVD